jgi:hypothetical protein
MGLNPRVGNPGLQFANTFGVIFGFDLVGSQETLGLQFANTFGVDSAVFTQ